MSTNVTWNGTTYSIPASGETGWSALSNFLIALGNNAAIAEEMKQAMRVATTTPVTVSDTTDCVVMTKLASAGAVAVNLPAGTNGRWFVIGDQTGDAATNNITITPNGAETINGSATYVISENNGCVVLVYSSTNTKWNVVARFTSGSFMTNPMVTTGDMVYGGASGAPTKLATGATAGLLHGGNAAVPSWSLLVNADVSASAAIAGSKLVAAASGTAGAVSTSAQTFTGAKTFEDTTDSSSSTTGAVIVSGGVGIAKKLYVGTGIYLPSSGSTASQLNYYAEDDTTSSTWTWNGSGGTTGAMTIRLTRIGRVVTISGTSALATTGTGSTALNSNTAIPAAFRPSVNFEVFGPVYRINNNAAGFGPGCLTINSSGIMSLTKDGAGTAFTNSQANSGFDGPWAITYTIY